MTKLIKEKNAPGQFAQGSIPLSVPEINGNAWKYIKDCLDTGWVSSVGAYVDRFETTLANFVGRKYSIACVSGTAALHMALMVAGIKADEEVIMPTLTFAAPAFAVRYLGAWPVFIDVEPDYWQMDINKVREFIAKDCRRVRGKLINIHTGRVVRAIIPVHVLGHPVDMKPLLELAVRHNLVVIEDVAESLGAKYQGKRLGGFGHLACFSFNGNKVITSGGGGMLLTDDLKMAQRARHLTTQAKKDPIEYVHDEIGYNYRLTNIQAALGLSQLEKIEDSLKCKKLIAERYHKGLADIPGILRPQQASWATHIWWLYTIAVNKKYFGMDSRLLMKELALQGIQSRPLWHPLHSQKIFKGSFSFEGKVADHFYKSALSLPSSVGLKLQDQEKVIEILRRTCASK